MRVNNKLILGASIVILLNFASCKKYEEGPAFSLKSKTKRLTAQEWEVKDLDVSDDDGFSMLEFLNEWDDDAEFDLRLIENFGDEIFIEFDEDGDFEIEFEGSHVSQETDSYYSNEATYEFDVQLVGNGVGEWEWSDDKSEITLEFDRNGMEVELKGKVKIEMEFYGYTYSYTYVFEDYYGSCDMEDIDFKVLKLKKDELKFEDNEDNIWELEP